VYNEVMGTGMFLMSRKEFYELLWRQGKYEKSVITVIHLHKRELIREAVK
jgi:hypothetical protein